MTTDIAIRQLSAPEKLQAFITEYNRWKHRHNRVSVKWRIPRALADAISDAWILNGGYNGTNNGPSSLYEPALRIALALDVEGTPAGTPRIPRKEEPVTDDSRKRVMFRIDADVLEELERRSKAAGMDVTDYAVRLLAAVVPNLLAAAARNMLNRELNNQSSGRAKDSGDQT
jgi:hypothetical protein